MNLILREETAADQNSGQTLLQIEWEVERKLFFSLVSFPLWKDFACKGGSNKALPESSYSLKRCFHISIIVWCKFERRCIGYLKKLHQKSHFFLYLNLTRVSSNKKILSWYSYLGDHARSIPPNFFKRIQWKNVISK